MDIDEAHIIRRVLSGDVNAYALLVKANEKHVYNLAYKMTGNEHDARDISQEAFLKAYLNLQTFNGTSKFSVWLYRLTYNLCVDFIRSKSMENTVSADDEEKNVLVNYADERQNTEETVIEKEQYALVMETLRAMPDKYRSVLVMHSIEDMKYSDIASALDINDGTVKSRIARARRILAKKIKEKGTICENKRHNSSEGGEVDE